MLPGELTAFRQGPAIAAQEVLKFRQQRGRGKRGGRCRGIRGEFSGENKRESKLFRGSACEPEGYVDQLIFTDNSVVYFSVRKGRSSFVKVNSLCQFMLLIQIVTKIKIHPRWVSTKIMPADYLTRAETYKLLHASNN